MSLMSKYTELFEEVAKMKDFEHLRKSSNIVRHDRDNVSSLALKQHINQRQAEDLAGEINELALEMGMSKWATFVTDIFGKLGIRNTFNHSVRTVLNSDTFTTAAKEANMDTINGIYNLIDSRKSADGIG